MGKYDPLKAYLRRQRVLELQMTFREIENLIGYLLPRSAQKPDWWSGAALKTGRAVQLQAWRDAGFEAALSVGADRVTFTRT